MVDAYIIANSILDRAFDEGVDVSPMKLQKLLYFVYKKYYKDTAKPLFPERFEVWQYGPVVSSVYQLFREFGSKKIKRFYEDNDGDIYVISKNNEEFRTALDFVWGRYSQYDGIELSEFTHREGTAWYKAFNDEKPFLNDDDILAEVWA